MPLIFLVLDLKMFSLNLQDRLVISICKLQSMCLSTNCLENVSCELILYLLKALGYSYGSL